MSTQKNSLAGRPRLGPKEVRVLAFLELAGGSAWKGDVIDKFAWANRYRSVMNRRLYRLQQKGFIFIKTEVNPKTGQEKQKVYLVK